jgi:hypothetical protein
MPEDDPVENLEPQISNAFDTGQVFQSMPVEQGAFVRSNYLHHRNLNPLLSTIPGTARFFDNSLKSIPMGTDSDQKSPGQPV